MKDMKFFTAKKNKEQEPFRFSGGEIVRLKKDYPEDGLETGDCGVVWGVYDGEFYEASFFRPDGRDNDLMFQEDEVEEVTDIQQTPCPERIKEFQNWRPPEPS